MIAGGMRIQSYADTLGTGVNCRHYEAMRIYGAGKILRLKISLLPVLTWIRAGGRGLTAGYGRIGDGFCTAQFVVEGFEIVRKYRCRRADTNRWKDYCRRGSWYGWSRTGALFGELVAAGPMRSR